MEGEYSTKKKLISICDIHSNKEGSFEEFLIAITKKLTANGYEHLIVFRDYPIRSVEEPLIEAGAKIEVIKLTRFGFYNFLLLFTNIRKHKPFLIHLHFFPTYSAINLLKYVLNTKVVCTDHMGGRKPHSNIKKLFRKYYYYFSFILFGSGISKIICVSNFVKQKYSKDYGIQSDKLQVIYNGINMAKFQRKENIIELKEKFGLGDEYIVSCIGLRKDKGPHCLLKAAPLIIDKICNVKFLFVGTGDCSDYLKNKIKNDNLSEYCIFTGNILDPSDIYTISDCVVIPSLVEEAFCFVAAEAIACGSEVIAFDSGAIKEVLNNSQRVISRDYNELYKNIISLYHSESSPYELREYIMKNFSLETNVDTHLNLYNSL